MDVGVGFSSIETGGARHPVRSQASAQGPGVQLILKEGLWSMGF